MNIVLCAQSFNEPLIGGVDVYADRLGRALSADGHDVAILSLDPSADSSKEVILRDPDTRRGMTIHSIAFSLAGRSDAEFAVGYDSRLIGVMTQALRRARAQLFVVANFYLPSMAAVEAARNLNLPIVHIATDYVPVCRRGTMFRWDETACQTGESVLACSACFVSEDLMGRISASMMSGLDEDFVLRLAEKDRSQARLDPLRLLQPYWRQVNLTRRRLEILSPLRKSIDLVLAPTTNTRRIFVENGFAEDQVELLPFGVDPALPVSRPPKDQGAGTRFLFIGRLQPYKGAHLLVDAFDRLERPTDSTLTLYGIVDGHEHYFERLLAKVDANPSINFGGRLVPSDLAKAFSETDYFVLPSLWHENSPLTLLDALQSGTPVIASQIGGVTDFVQPDRNGLLFPMGDGDALRTLLQRAIDEPGLARKLSLDKGVSLLSIEEYAGRMMGLIRAKVPLGLVKEGMG